MTQTQVDRAMTTETGDTGFWVAAGGLVLAAVTMLANWLRGGIGWLTKDSKAAGVIDEWRKSMEQKVSALEAQNSEFSKSMRGIADREEMAAGFDRLRGEMTAGNNSLAAQIRELSLFMHEIRNGRTPHQPPYRPPQRED